MGLPVEINNLMLGSLGGYTVGRSLRFRSSASAYLNRTPASTGNRQKFTWSGWVKRGLLTTGTYYQLFGAGPTSGGNEGLFFDTTSGGLYFTPDATNAIVTSSVYRDPSAWYHIVLAVDTTQATATNREIIYVNGVQVTSYTGTYCAQNTNFNYINVASAQHRIGAHLSSGYYFDGYMAEVNFIDGQALTPSSFGAYDTNGVWQPKKYTGTYGTNGFYLPFSNTASTSTYGGSFNGSSQRLSVSSPSTSLINWYSSNFTLEYWINPTSFTATTVPNVIGNMEHNTGSNYWSFGPLSGGAVSFYWYSGTSNSLTTTQTITAGQWSHLAFVKNGTTLTVYINGVSAATTTLSNSPQSNNTNPLQIGAYQNTYFNGALSNLRIVNGTAVYTSNFTPPTSPLTAITNTSFLTLQNATIVDNSTNAYTITNTGSVATSVQYPFNTANIASDQSGNGNNWTTNNISLVNGTTYDSMIDSPTNSASSSNYAVLNPLLPVSVTGYSISDGNLKFTTTNVTSSASTINLPQSGKWYWEATLSAGTSANLGVVDNTYQLVAGSNPADQTQYGYSYENTTGKKLNNGIYTTYGATYTTNDIIGVAFDSDNGTLAFYKNGTSQGTAFTGLTNKIYYPFFALFQSTWTVNFGQRPFSYTPPTGYSALNTYNLPAPSIAAGNKHFDIVLRNGFGSSGGSITSLGFKPDMVWNKGRNLITNNNIMDSIRGPSQIVSPNLASVEQTATTFFTSFNSNGYSMGTGDHATTTTLVDWAWKGGGTGVSNTSGTITSTVSANPSAGFSIATYSGNGTNGATVGHGLGVKPDMIIIKGRNASTGSSQWICQHVSLSGGVTANSSTFTLSGYTQAIYLNLTNAAASYAFDAQVNGASGTYVAYCFSAVRGYSAFGSYTGNGSADGPFVYTGFRPRWVLLKNASLAVDWILYDTSRSTYNVTNLVLQPSQSAAEVTAVNIDVLSNGFKIRTTDQAANNSGQTYIYAAFAENPFTISRAK